MARFGANDWVNLGLTALAERGEAALRIDAITARAGKTRGSFYHHFASHDDFLAAILGRWRETHVAALNAAAEYEDGASTGAGSLNRMAASLDLRLEGAIRRLAASNPLAATVVTDIDGARVKYMRSLQADPHSEAAADYALIEYAVFIGMQSLLPDADPGRREALGRLTSDMITVHWNE